MQMYLIFFLLTAVLAAPVPVYKVNNKPAPSQFTPTTLTTIGRWSHYWKNGLCGMDGTDCMNRRALELVNEMRVDAGIKPLKMGTKKMLQNALSHTKAQQLKSSIYHQEGILRPGIFICEKQLVGENVAQNHIFLDKSTTASDPVRMCMKQFYDSPPHKRNMLSTGPTFFVQGTIFDQLTGYIWCTQTFWGEGDGEYGTGNCAMA